MNYKKILQKNFDENFNNNVFYPFKSLLTSQKYLIGKNTFFYFTANILYIHNITNEIYKQHPELRNEIDSIYSGYFKNASNIFFNSYDETTLSLINEENTTQKFINDIYTNDAFSNLDINRYFNIDKKFHSFSNYENLHRHGGLTKVFKFFSIDSNVTKKLLKNIFLLYDKEQLKILHKWNPIDADVLQILSDINYKKTYDLSITTIINYLINIHLKENNEKYLINDHEVLFKYSKSFFSNIDLVGLNYFLEKLEFSISNNISGNILSKDTNEIFKHIEEGLLNNPVMNDLNIKDIKKFTFLRNVYSSLNPDFKFNLKGASTLTYQPDDLFNTPLNVETFVIDISNINKRFTDLSDIKNNEIISIGTQVLHSFFNALQNLKLIDNYSVISGTKKFMQIHYVSFMPTDDFYNHELKDLSNIFSNLIDLVRNEALSSGEYKLSQKNIDLFIEKFLREESLSKIISKDNLKITNTIKKKI